VPRIDCKVQNCKLKLVAVDPRRREIGITGDFEINRWSQSSLQQFLDVRDQNLQIDGPWLQALLPGKREQSFNEHDATVGGLYGALQQRNHGRIPGRTSHRQLQIADHSREKIGEIVGDAAGQLTNRLELLSLAQGRLGLPMLAHLCPQADIGRVQLNPKPQSLGKKPVEVRSGEGECHREDDNHRRQGSIRH